MKAETKLKNEEKSKPIKTAVFGGSFDPLHYGHYDIVKNLEKNFDRVIVVPSYISPFKSGEAAADGRAKARLALCKKVFASDKTEVCAREIKKGGVSYSIDTAKYLAKRTDKLFWVIGSEEVATLGYWHDIQALARLVTFYVVPRPGYKVSSEQVKSLKKLGVKLKTANFEGLDISSSRIKIDIAFGKPNSFLPSVVKKAADKNGLFNPYGKYVAALYKYNLSAKRIEHTYGVAVRGAELAKLYGYPVNDAIIACILHDIAKTVNPDDYAGKVDVSGFPAPTVHGPIGAYIAKREFGVSDEIAHAIKYHSTGDGEMSLLDEIVYLADKTEAGRSYNEVFYLRYLCSCDRDAAMYKTLSEIADYTDSRVCEYTSRAIELYAEKLDGREIPEMPQTEPPSTASALPMVRHSGAVGDIKSKAVKVVVNSPKSLLNVNVISTKPAVVADKAIERAARNDGHADSVRDIAVAVANELDLHKAHDVEIIDLGGKTIIADYFVLASANSSTAVKALRGYVEDMLTKKYSLDPLRRDIDGEWIALDYGGVIVHIFTDKTREFYNIERLWSDGANVTKIGEN